VHTVVIVCNSRL